ncbi:MAG: endolytic transglycosylase MltG [Bacteroidota bacterium]|nr:endolytic transglycosylase MltG [Bacteroidota bacterium]
MAKNPSAWRKMVLPLGIVFLLLAVASAYFTFIVWGGTNIVKDDVFILDEKMSIEDVTEQLSEEGFIKHTKGMLWLAEQKQIKEVFPGYYSIDPSMNNNDVLNVLRQGKFQTNVVSVTVPEGKWRPEDVAVSIAHQLNLEGDEKSQFINDLMGYFSSYMTNSSLSSNCAYTCIEEVDEELPNFFESIIPNTYSFERTATAEDVYRRLLDEQAIWWNTESRMANLERLGLSPKDVVIIASIVEKETNYSEEKGDLAMVYMNRIAGPNESAGYLQADPTSKFAIGELYLRRVTKKETKCDCPFNTYKIKGLPPAPICMPSKETLDSVLNAQPHDYYYFCADPVNFNLPRSEHKHILSKTFREHKIVAKAYQAALDEYLRLNP